MNITKVESKNELSDSDVKEFTQEELEREYDYYLIQKLLAKMLEKGLITAGEFNKITEKNRQIFSPYLAEIMPKMT